MPCVYMSIVTGVIISFVRVSIHIHSYFGLLIKHFVRCDIVNPPHKYKKNTDDCRYINSDLFPELLMASFAMC